MSTDKSKHAQSASKKCKWWITVCNASLIVVLFILFCVTRQFCSVSKLFCLLSEENVLNLQRFWVFPFQFQRNFNPIYVTQTPFIVYPINFIVAATPFSRLPQHRILPPKSREREWLTSSSSLPLFTASNRPWKHLLLSLQHLHPYPLNQFNQFSRESLKTAFSDITCQSNNQSTHFRYQRRLT